MPTSLPRKPWYRVLYFQVLMAVVLGIVVGCCFPAFGKSLKPLGDGFIKLVKMMIAPIIFCTVVHGLLRWGTCGNSGASGARHWSTLKSSLRWRW